MLRIAVIDGAVAFDPEATAPGRGAWVHPTPGCLERLERERGRLRHALRTECALRAPLISAARQVLQERAHAALTRAASAGALRSGARDLAASVSADQIVALAVASDASSRTVAELTADPSLVWARLHLDRTALGAIVHRGPRAAVGATRSIATRQLVSQLHMLRSLG